MQQVYLLPQIAIRARQLIHGDGDPVALAQHFVQRGAQQIQIRDVDGSYASNPAGSDALGVIAAAVDVPMQFDAALTDPRAIERVSRTRTASVVISMEGLFEPLLIRWALDTLGAGRTVLEIPADGEYLYDPPPNGFAMRVADAAQAAQRAGVEHVLIRDVTALAPSIHLLRRICADTQLQVSYSGPVTSAGDIRELAIVGAQLRSVIVGEPLFDGRLPIDQALAAVDSVK